MVSITIILKSVYTQLFHPYFVLRKDTGRGLNVPTIHWKIMRQCFLICAIMLFMSCSSNVDNQFIIDGRINGAEEGEMICLSYPIKQGEIWKRQYDTTYLRGGRFCFRGCIDDLRAASLSFPNMDYANLYIEPARITFKA